MQHHLTGGPLARERAGALSEEAARGDDRRAAAVHPAERRERLVRGFEPTGWLVRQQLRAVARHDCGSTPGGAPALTSLAA